MHSLTLLEKSILFQTNQTESWQYPLIQNQETLTLESSQSMKERGLWLTKSQKSGGGGGILFVVPISMTSVQLIHRDTSSANINKPQYNQKQTEVANFHK